MTLIRSVAHSSILPPTTFVERIEKVCVRFDAEFLERRLRSHREQMQEYEAELASDVIVEVAAGIDFARRAKAAKRLK